MKRRILLGLFGLSYVGLALWAFPGIRQTIRLHVLSWFGAASTGGPTIAEDVFLSQFRPDSQLKTRQTIVSHPFIPTVEFHGHLFTSPTSDPPEDILTRMDQTQTSVFVNLSLFTSTPHSYQKLVEKQPSKRIFHFVGFNWKRMSEGPDFAQKMASDLEQIAKMGGRGVKLWKNFGLMQKYEGKLVTLDDPRLDPVWDVCAKYHLLVAVHTADPPVFFLPVDEHNERFEELGRRPEWSFHKPGLPSFDDVMQQRDRLFTRRKDVTFVALHFGEFAHDLSRAQDLLDRHPNVYVDIAQRIDELGRQPRAAREFLIKNQNRILYGTDGLPDPEKLKIYWRFLETDDEYFDYFPAGTNRKGVWKIYGVKLPPDVLRKIYYSNAARLLRIQ